MTALSFLSSTFFFIIAAFSICFGVVRLSEPDKGVMISTKKLGWMLVIHPLVYLTLHLIVIWQ